MLWGEALQVLVGCGFTPPAHKELLSMFSDVLSKSFFLVAFRSLQIFVHVVLDAFWIIFESLK